MENDAFILAKCVDEEENDDDSQTTYSEASSAPTQPEMCSMGGTTVNIDRSKDIHIGPKTVSSPPTMIPSFSSQQSTCTQEDDVSLLSESSNSLAYSFDASSQASFDSSRFPPESFTVNLTPAPSETSKDKILRKSASTPLNSRGDASVASSEHNFKQIVPSCQNNQLVPSNAPPNAGTSLTSHIANSSNVQMGTQIVYNYYRCMGNQEVRLYNIF